MKPLKGNGPELLDPLPDSLKVTSLEGWLHSNPGVELAKKTF